MLRKHLSIVAVAALMCGQSVALRAQATSSQSTQEARPPAASNASGQQTPARPTTPTAGQQQPQTQRGGGFDLTEYGVYIEPEPRLIVVMAALEAAGFEPTPAGAEPSAFRAMVRRDQANLNPALRERLQSFYRLNKLPATATPAEQAARYVSLAFALGEPPAFEAPARSDDLPSGLLEVLDFAPLVREFYRQSGIEERLPQYVRDSQTAGNNLRPATSEMVRSVLSYLHTRPTTAYTERVPATDSAKSSASKKSQPERRIMLTREKQRRFQIVPDLLAVPGTVNFRIIGDDYYAVVPYGVEPASSEMRRAYLQYVIDPLVVRFNRDIAARREDLRAMLDEARAKFKNDASPDVFLSVGRSLVAAADARMNEQSRLAALTNRTSVRLKEAKTETERAQILKESQGERTAIEDATVAQLADAYERGALLSFYFAEQLRSIESSGFDIASFLPDMLASFDAARERRRPAEYASARERFNAARLKEQQARAALRSELESSPQTARRAALIKRLEEVDDLLRLKNYTEAETRLRALAQEFQGEPRIFFALGQAASLSAEQAFDENLQAERLNQALSLYRMTVERASSDTDRALISRAHAAMGRILAFLERNEEALQAFDAAIKLGEVEGGAYRDALAGKQKLQSPD